MEQPSKAAANRIEDLKERRISSSTSACRPVAHAAWSTFVVSGKRYLVCSGSLPRRSPEYARPHLNAATAMSVLRFFAGKAGNS